MTRIVGWLGAALLGAGVALAALVVVAAVPAHACSCVQLDDATALSGADVVFTGRLVDRMESSPGLFGARSSADPAILTFAVDRVFKGHAAAEQRVSTASSGASCGWELTGEGPFVVFAQGAGSSMNTSLCSGNRAGAVPAGWGGGSPPLGDQARPTPAGPPGLLRTVAIAAGLVAAGTAAVLALARVRGRRRPG
jgi:hypothetical protein